MNGTIPFELSHLKRLERLDLSTNKLIGTVSPELYTLSSLITFYISDNALTGTVSNDIGNLKNLEYLVGNFFLIEICYHQYFFILPLIIGSIPRLHP